MYFVWTMTYGTNYTLTTVWKLIFSAGHKINRHNGRNIYPPMVRVKIPNDERSTTDVYLNECKHTQRQFNVGKYDFPWIHFKLTKLERSHFPIWIFRHSVSFDRLFQRIWSIPSVLDSLVWAQWNRYLVRILFSYVLTVVSAIPRFVRCNFFTQIFYNNEPYELSCWIDWNCLFVEIIQNTNGFKRIRK